MSGKSTGTANSVKAMTSSCNGTPSFAKSLNLYPPGPRTSVFTGEATGVEKAVDAAMATVISKEYGEIPIFVAAPIAMGPTRTVVAGF